MKLCIPVAEPNGLASTIEPHLPQAGYLLFFDTELRSCQVLSMRELSEGTADGILMDAVLCGSINRITLKTLLEQGVAVYGTDATTAEQAITQFENGELQAAVLGLAGAKYRAPRRAETGQCRRCLLQRAESGGVWARLWRRAWRLWRSWIGRRVLTWPFACARWRLLRQSRSAERGNGSAGTRRFLQDCRV